METAIEQEQQRQYEHLATIYDIAIFAVDPRERKKTEDRFREVTLNDGTISKLNEKLNWVLRSNGRLVVTDPRAKGDNPEFARYVHILESKKVTTIALKKIEHQPHFVDQISGNISLGLEHDNDHPGELILGIEKDGEVAKTITTWQSDAFNIGIHHGYIFPALVKEAEATGQITWFLNEREP